ncbi:hypothetical protein FHP29_13220, partial [Nocardioides albidus]
MDQFRAQAVELLADPYAAVRFLEDTEDAADAGNDGDAAPPPSHPEPKPERKRKGVVYAHLDAAVLASLLEGGREGGVEGVARVEDLGPMLLEQLAELLRHRHITLTPVIDL